MNPCFKPHTRHMNSSSIRNLINYRKDKKNQNIIIKNQNIQLKYYLMHESTQLIFMYEMVKDGGIIL